MKKVDAVYYSDMPVWYLRATAPFRLTFRREVISLAVLFAAGLLLGALVVR